MNEKDVERWCKAKSKPMINLQSPKAAILHDFDLVWNYYSSTRKGGAANIVHRPGFHVEGVLFELSQSDLGLIAEKEGSPNFYRPITVSVKLRDGRIDDRVVTYTVREEMTRHTFTPPTREYLSIVIEGAEGHGLSAGWIRKLRSVQASD